MTTSDFLWLMGFFGAVLVACQVWLWVSDRKR
jgi:hypothetical protein